MKNTQSEKLLSRSESTIQSRGRDLRSENGSARPGAYLVFAGRAPSQESVAALERETGYSIVSTHGINDWLNTENPCQTAKQIADELHSLPDDRHVIFVLCPYAPMASLFAIAAASKWGRSGLTLVYLHHNRDFTVIIDPECLHELG